MTGLRRTALARKTALRRTGGLQRKTPMVRVAMAKLCRMDLSMGATFSRHHRRPRGMGGSTASWINDVSNLLLLCGTATSGCHQQVEANRTASRANGWLVPLGYHPAEVPVSLHASISRKPVFLDNAGNYIPGSP